ncbi:DNA repair protein RadA [Desulfolucanica intricata]|uniref:DNA repair protein RadA n=1 Tax=Desulfolucanica intricata TaxID=1285191 RepID=UPI00082EBA61|nr:DNA repair protein RadA [Desulfolucanica intricata]
MRVKTGYCCQECGHQSARWMGRCPGCGAWNSMVEEILPAGGTSGAKKSSQLQEPLQLTEIPLFKEERISTGMKELDRVLGGGIVPGSLILLGGEPGIGKSTLLLQVAFFIGERQKDVLYISGEESMQQVRLRAQRLNALSPKVLILAENDVDRVERCIKELKPSLVIIDSVQTIFKENLSSSPGSVGQVRECSAQLMRLAKGTGVAVFLVGHVTKDGSIAGPKVLEHMVDAVLYFEGDRRQAFRLLRGVKNRYGSTNEIGIFDMCGTGLQEVANPSALFMQHWQVQVPGSVIVPTIEGSRPLLVEVQALVCSSGFGVPRRMAAGVDYNRVALIIAVLEKRLGFRLGKCDIYINAVGGVKIDEPAVDLGIAIAITSSFHDVAVSQQLAVVGEIGLTGEVRPVAAVDKRLVEAGKMGFRKTIIPKANLPQVYNGETEAIGVKTVAEAVEIVFKGLRGDNNEGR